MENITKKRKSNTKSIVFDETTHHIFKTHSLLFRKTIKEIIVEYAEELDKKNIEKQMLFSSTNKEEKL